MHGWMKWAYMAFIMYFWFVLNHIRACDKHTSKPGALHLAQPGLTAGWQAGWLAGRQAGWLADEYRWISRQARGPDFTVDLTWWGLPINIYNKIQLQLRISNNSLPNAPTKYFSTKGNKTLRCLKKEASCD